MINFRKSEYLGDSVLTFLTDFNSHFRKRKKELVEKTQSERHKGKGASLMSIDLKTAPLPIFVLLVGHPYGWSL